VVEGAEERITQALREWHEKNTFKKVGSFSARENLLVFTSRQGCSNKELMEMQHEDS
jgi:hypothetical protein